MIPGSPQICSSVCWLQALKTEQKRKNARVPSRKRRRSVKVPPLSMMITVLTTRATLQCVALRDPSGSEWLSDHYEQVKWEKRERTGITGIQQQGRGLRSEHIEFERNSNTHSYIIQTLLFTQVHTHNENCCVVVHAWLRQRDTFEKLTHKDNLCN